MEKSLSDRVWRRAVGICEYCHYPSAADPLARFEIDHIIAQKHRGPTRLGNLALACSYCNAFKGCNIGGVDPVTKKRTWLFHPRKHLWAHHFRWNGLILVGRTAIGRTTIDVLNMNSWERVVLREDVFEEGTFLF